MTTTTGAAPMGADSDWPRDPANGHLLCTPQRPMPKGAAGLWSHTSVALDGGCDEGCCDDFKCNDCGATWRVEYDG